MSVYVSPEGNDSWDGSEKRPFRTLPAARDALRAAGRGPEKRIVVRGGTYFDACLTLGPEDSGLTIEAAPEEEPVLYGGRRVEGWTPDGDRFIAAELDGVKEGRRDFRMLVVNGEFAPRARLPAEGVLLHDSVFDGSWMSTTAGGWDRKPTREELTTMKYRAGDLGDWLDAKTAEVRVYHQWDESLVGVESIDTRARTLTFSSPCTHPPGAFARHGGSEKSQWYVVWNVREGMQEPGQWYLDRARGMLVYWPRPGETPETLAVIAPTLPTVFRVEGSEDEPVKDVRLRGLTIGATTTELKSAGFGGSQLEAAVSLGFAEDVALERLTVRSVGGKGVGVLPSSHPKGRGARCRRVRVDGCVLESCGGPGVALRGDECAVTDTLVETVGRTYPSSIALSCSGARCLVSHNEVAGCPYSAVVGSGDDTVIEFNRLQDFMKELDDGAAIYTFAGRGVVHRGNVARGASGRLAHAYYLDECSERCIVERNLAVGTGSPSHNHMARECVVRENVFVDEGASRLTFAKCRGFMLDRNVIAGERISVNAPRDGLGAMPRNVFFARSEGAWIEWTGESGYGVAATEALVMRDGSVLADPMFADPDGGDYSFLPGSPARELGIQPPDFSKAGRRSR